MPTSRVLVLLLLMVCCAFGAEPPVQRAEPRENQDAGAVTNAAMVRSLSPEQASRRLPVHLQGVITYVFDRRAFFIQDQTAGIFVGNGVQGPPLALGDLVSVEGVSHPGDYAPLMQPSRIELLDHTNLPPARRVTYADLMTGHEDSQWVEIVGLVRAAYAEPQAQRMLDIDMGGGRVTLFLPDVPASDLMRLVDSTVRVRGVCGTWFNKLRQLFGVR